MKMTMLILATIVIVCLCFCYVRCRKHDNDVARSICKMAFPGIATVIFAMVMLFTTHRNISMLAYSLYFISTGWLLYFLLSYAVLYVGKSIKETMNLPIMYALLAADAVIMISNIFTEKLFTVTYRIYSDELSYYKFEASPLFAFHACFVYSLVAFTFAALIYRIYHTGSVYRKKYIPVTLIVGIIVIANALFMFIGAAIDFSVFGYAIGGLLIYYYSLEYIPTVLKYQTMTLVADDMSEGLIILDENNECIYMNNCAQRILGVDASRLELDGTIAEEWLDIHNLKNYKDTVINYKHEGNYEDRYYKVSFNRIDDEKNYYIGSYFFIQDFTAEHRRIDEEHYKATHNGLTGLYTTEHFFDMAEKALMEHPDDTYLMICSDISNFKLVNDLVGWEYGNEVLVHIAEAFRMSATPDEVYGYMGSDRFAILIPKDQYDETWFKAMASDITYTKEDISYVLNIYFGIYEINDRSIPVSVMCDRAYMILNTIKGSYTQRIVYYTDEVRENVIRENELVGALDGALNNEEFEIYLQPQVSIDRKLIGAEALVRWKHPEKGFVSPGEFIPIFEKKNVISKLDVYIWHRACKVLKRWKDEGREDLSISVNISPKNLYTLDVYRIFMDLVARYEIEPKNLRLEITETAIMTDIAKQNDLIRKLQQAGFFVEMDDFGSGYSSLNMLKEISVDVIKIDRIFLEDSTNIEKSKYILETVIQLSKQLNMEIIAEGVETKEQVDYLTGLGCDIFQGYYFDKPISVAEFEEKYLQ